MTGRLIGVVGPSGVGKDSVMLALAKADKRLSLVKRTITRAVELGGEDYHAVFDFEFLKQQDAGEFCLLWRAHEMHYGIPNSIKEQLANGNDLLVNLSRSVLQLAAQEFEQFQVLQITASADTVAKRLVARGRESVTDIEKRLLRLNYPLPDGVNATIINNDGTIEEALNSALEVLYPSSL